MFWWRLTEPNFIEWLLPWLDLKSLVTTYESIQLFQLSWPGLLWRTWSLLLHQVHEPLTKTRSVTNIDFWPRTCRRSGRTLPFRETARSVSIARRQDWEVVKINKLWREEFFWKNYRSSPSFDFSTATMLIEENIAELRDRAWTGPIFWASSHTR